MWAPHLAEPPSKACGREITQQVLRTTKGVPLPPALTSSPLNSGHLTLACGGMCPQGIVPGSFWPKGRSQGAVHLTRLAQPNSMDTAQSI